MVKAKSLKGNRYGKITVLDKVEYRFVSGRNRLYCECLCDCGTIKFLSRESIISNYIISCGCRKKNGFNHTHDESKTRLYYIWGNMKKRTTNSKEIAYPRYGGRGIKICDEWLNSYECFRDWAINNGYKENLTIDRIDNNGNYEPNNCRWATPLEQVRNRSNSINISYFGQTKSAKEWSEYVGISYKYFHQLIHKNKKSIEFIIKKYKHEAKEN